MKWRYFIGTLVTASLSVSALNAASKERPNLLFIMTDQQQYVSAIKNHGTGEH